MGECNTLAMGARISHNVLACLYVSSMLTGNMTGVVSERDYVCKIALLGRTSKDTQVKQISTKAPNLVTAKQTDTVEDCMARMLTKGEKDLIVLYVIENCRF